MVDGKEGKKYDEINKFVFSPDGEKVAYITYSKGEWITKSKICVDKIEGKRLRRIMEIDFTPKFKLKPFTPPSYIKTPIEIIFTPDSKHLIYKAKKEEKSKIKYVIGIEGKIETPEYDGFLEGSSIVFDAPNLFHTIAIKNGEMFLVEVEIKEK